jgi:hypothetical protein
MRASSMFLAVFAPLWLSGIALASCAAPVAQDGEGGAGGTTSAQSSASSSSASSVSSVSSGAGGCIYAEDCTAMTNACNVGACINGACGKLPANELAGCDDGKFCTQNDFCKKGKCEGGSAPACPPGDACHVGVCDEATRSCAAVPGNDGGPCEDNDPCTATGVCKSGVCDASAPIDCSIFDDVCSVGVCDPMSGCKPQPVNDGKACNDGKLCTANDSCKGGVCAGTAIAACQNGDQCCPPGCSSASDDDCP